MDGIQEYNRRESLGITAFSTLDTPDGAFVGGNEIQSRATYTRDGLVRDLASVNFIADPAGLSEIVDINTNPNGYTSALGGSGDDIIHGGLGNDVLDGGQDQDLLKGGAGNDRR